ncbi:MAG: hypothetical protein IPM29_12480 [Planctomycetes bacterium]|nr:hypothetical protein [Planctomycetota bacterium]
MTARRRSVRGAACGVALALLGCATATDDLSGLAERPVVPASVLVTGGAFVDAPGVAARPSDGAEPLARTFARTGGPAEAVPLSDVLAALVRGRVFARIERDTAATDTDRERLAGLRGNLSLQSPDVGRLLERARGAGHDYVLIVQRLQDGPVEGYGINDRWPLTVSLWLLVGLGLVIPDHTFESRASLQASLFEVYTGREVHRALSSGGPVELALVNRTGLWGLVQSILIPPFWVDSDDELVADEMRARLARRLPAALARQLKSEACRQDLADRARASFVVDRAADGLRVVVRSLDGLSLCALRADGRAMTGAVAERFARELLASERHRGDEFVYEAVLLGPPPGRYVQILVQSVVGDAASATIDAAER